MANFAGTCTSDNKGLLLLLLLGPSRQETPEELADHDYPRAGPSVPWPDGPATTP